MNLNGKVQEVYCGTNPSFILQEDQLLALTSYKVIQSQNGQHFIKCSKIKKNGQIQLIYLTGGYQSLESLLPRLTADKFMMIVARLLDNLMMIRNNGFLSWLQIVLRPEQIYIMPDTLQVRFIYLPLRFSLYEDERIFETTLRENLVRMIYQYENLQSLQTKNMTADLQEVSVKLEMIYAKLGGRQNTGMSPISNELNPPDGEEPRLYLTSIDQPKLIELIVTKPEFVIGKKAGLVDGVIDFNAMISRVHCKITRIQGQFHIEDLNSANGTFVNGRRLIKGERRILTDRDVVRLANTDFKVTVR
ncbi:MAG: FHA domain-containing protein [Lachnospiraceae bacterium]|nr:FHA domain-containing protein [Lachnospiraceae bacterium]